MKLRYYGLAAVIVFIATLAVLFSGCGAPRKTSPAFELAPMPTEWVDYDGGWVDGHEDPDGGVTPRAEASER